MAFRDDFPQDPPPLGDDWAHPIDRRGHDSLEEVRAAMREISDLVSGLQRMTIPLPDGRVVDVIAAERGYAEAVYGFQVSWAEEDRVAVSPSVVSGMGAWATVPKIGSNSLTASPAPTLNVSGKRWVCLKMEIIPGTEHTIVAEDPADNVYLIAEGSGTLHERGVTVEAYLDEDSMMEDSQIPEITAATGEVVENGIYVVPLAWLDDEDVWRQVGYSGPLGVRLCRSGAFIALGPAKGPAIEIPAP